MLKAVLMLVAVSVVSFSAVAEDGDRFLGKGWMSASGGQSEMTKNTVGQFELRHTRPTKSLIENYGVQVGDLLLSGKIKNGVIKGRFIRIHRNNQCPNEEVEFAGKIFQLENRREVLEARVPWNIVNEKCEILDQKKALVVYVRD